MNKLKKQLDDLTSALVDQENELLVWADELGNEKLLVQAAHILVNAANALKEVSKLATHKMSFDLEVEANSIIPTDLDAIAALAKEFDESNDPFLQKQAAVIDQLLINFAQQNLKRVAETEEEAELAKLRAKYRAEDLKSSYEGPREAHEKDIKAADAVKKVKDQIKEYRPLQASLSTRYCPDHPGTQMRRVGDARYQCALDKKVYDWQSGFTTMKGNKVPGGEVSRQTQHLGDRALEEMHFSTRENRLQNMD